MSPGKYYKRRKRKSTENWQNKGNIPENSGGFLYNEE